MSSLTRLVVANLCANAAIASNNFFEGSKLNGEFESSAMAIALIFLKTACLVRLCHCPYFVLLHAPSLKVFEMTLHRVSSCS